MPNEMFAEDDINLEEEIQKEESKDADDPAKKEVDTDAQTESVEAKDAQTEQNPDEEAGEKEKKETPRVPLPELLDERKKRQEAEREVNEFRTKQAVLEERISQIAERQKPTEVSYEDDAGEYLRRQAEQSGETVKELSGKLDKITEREEAVQQQNAITQRLLTSEAVFRQGNPDYDDAVNFLRSARADEYKAMGYQDSAQIEHLLTMEAFQLVQTAMQNNTDPAEMAYRIAGARGYQAKKPDAGTKDKLDNIQQGQERNKSLSNVGGGEEPATDAESLANMSDAEFNAAMKDGRWDKIMAGS